MIFVGIDPGKLGALAFIDEAGRVQQVMATPMRAGASRDDYDVWAIAEELRGWNSAQLFATVEKLHPLPPKLGGSIANHARGVADGWRWMLAGLGVPWQRVLLVLPQTWQRAMLAPARLGLDGEPVEDTKGRSIAAAQRLWPDLDLRRTERARRDCDAFSDALLLAEFGRRRRMGGTLFAAAARA